MAIDDNTLYGLTGAQVKELPGKIEAVKGLARELTAEDYNFHTSGDTDNRIALWLLPPGIYCWNRDLNQNILLTRSQSVTFSGNGMGAIVMNGHSYKPILLFNEPSQGFGLNYWEVSNGGYSGSGKWVSFSLVDNLTTDHGYEALSAKQGKALKDLIDSIAIRGAGAPTTSTVGQVGTLYEDTTNGDLYICTDAANPYVWEEVGGSSVNVVQSPGTSRTDVMSQYAATKLVYPDYSSTVLKAIKITGSTSSSAHSEEVTIGYGVSANAGRAAVGVGYQANNNGNRSVAIGNYARATADGSIAIGEGAYASTRGEMNIGTSTSASYGTSYGYNNTAYRLLTGLYDGQNDHDAATKGQLDSAVNGIESELDGKQDVLTAGQGISITDESGDLVISATSTGPNVVQTTGTSTTDVMSQNATTSMVYADPEAKTKIRIGGGTVGSATDPVVIGRAASVRGDYAVAIGSAAGSQVTNAPGGISLGAFSEAGGRGQMDISLATATQQAQANYGYNGSAYRLLTGLYDPQSDHDAATKGYVDTAVAGAGAATFTTNEWNALWA